MVVAADMASICKYSQYTFYALHKGHQCTCVYMQQSVYVCCVCCHVTHDRPCCLPLQWHLHLHHLLKPLWETKQTELDQLFLSMEALGRNILHMRPACKIPPMTILLCIIITWGKPSDKVGLNETSVQYKYDSNGTLCLRLHGQLLYTMRTVNQSQNVHYIWHGLLGMVNCCHQNLQLSTSFLRLPMKSKRKEYYTYIYSTSCRVHPPPC